MSDSSSAVGTFAARSGIGPPRVLAVRYAAAATAILALASCDSSVPVPSAAQDQPPVVHLTSFPVGGSGEVDTENVSASAVVTVTQNTEIMVLGSATNPGGVKQFSLKVIQNGITLYSVQTTGVADSTGNVPDTLHILGSDGAGCAGGSVALTFIETGAPASVLAVATNFNGQTNTTTITYKLWMPPPPPPKINSFTAAPNNGYINFGDTATLAWSIANCFTGCKVTMIAMDGLNYVDLLTSYPNLPASGSKGVSPRRSTFTRYTLTATSTLGSDSRSVVVQLYCPSGASCAPPAGMVFYFKMTNSTSQVLPCFPLAIYDKDAATAKQDAEAQNGGYTATPITYQEYVNGC